MNENFSFDTTMEVDIEDVENFITSEMYTQFLLDHTTQFSTAAFILQKGLEAVEEAKAYLANYPEENDEDIVD